MPAAGFAPLPIALLRLVVLPDELLTFGHGDGRRVPQRERVDRAAGPAPAVRAMAVARADRVARHDEPDRTTEALPFERLLVLTHETPSSWSVRPAIRARYRLARTSSANAGAIHRRPERNNLAPARAERTRDTRTRDAGPSRHRCERGRRWCPA